MGGLAPGQPRPGVRRLPLARPIKSPGSQPNTVASAVCQLDLDGIVAKGRADASTADTIWWKVKNPAYSQTEGRRELFERRFQSIVC
jgi:hypothetical protein